MVFVLLTSEGKQPGSDFDEEDLRHYSDALVVGVDELAQDGDNAIVPVSEAVAMIWILVFAESE